MTSSDRLKEYAKSPRGPHGAGRDQKNIDQWSARAEKNSATAPRATRKADLPSTGKQMALRDTETAPKVPRKVNARMTGRDGD